MDKTPVFGMLFLVDLALLAGCAVLSIKAGEHLFQVKDNKFAAAFAINALLLLASVAFTYWFVMYPGAVCSKYGYDRDDVYLGGKKLLSGSADGSASHSIGTEFLDENKKRVFTEYFNETELVYDCDRKLVYAARSSFIEFRSSLLTQALLDWRAGKNVRNQFHSGNLLTDRSYFTRAYSNDQRGYVWSPKDMLSDAPSWLPKEQLNEKSFVGFWENGFLFRGVLPDQYFWVG